MLGGRFVVSETLVGGPRWGLHRGVDQTTGARALLTTSVAPLDPEALRRALRLPSPPVAELLHAGPVSTEDSTTWVVGERRPDGRSLLTWRARAEAPRVACRALAGLAERLSELHAETGEVVAGLHPRLIFIDAAHGTLTGLAPRLRRVHEHAATEFNKPLLDPSFESFEYLIAQRREPASDVFSVAAIAYWLLAGEAPFGKTLIEETLAMSRGLTPDWAPLPQALRGVVAAALARSVDERPSLAELAEVLAEVV